MYPRTPWRPASASSAKRLRNRGRKSGFESERIREHQDLTIAVHAGTDPDRRDGEFLGDPSRNRPHHELDDDGKAPRSLQRPRLVEEPLRITWAPALDSRSSDRVHGLGNEPHMAHDRDSRPYQLPDRLARLLIPSLELHRLRARLLHDPSGAVEGPCGRGLIRHEGEVDDRERRRGAPPDGPRVRDHVVEGDGERRLVTHHHLTERIANQDDVDPPPLPGSSRRESRST